MDNNVLKGIVVDNIDPLKSARIKVRIPSLHGVSPDSSLYVQDNSLPWCYASIPFYSAQDCGSFIIPPVGSYVWLLQVEGDDPYYIYIGSSCSSASIYPKYINSENSSMGRYKTKINKSNMPEDLDSLEYGQSGVIFKSQKGSTVLYSDEDNKEFFEIIDRSGQYLKFNCPVSIEDNVGNKSKRINGLELPNGSIIMKSGKSILSLSNNAITANIGNSSMNMTENSIVLSVGRSSITITDNDVIIRRPNDN